MATSFTLDSMFKLEQDHYLAIYSYYQRLDILMPYLLKYPELLHIPSYTRQGLVLQDVSYGKTVVTTELIPKGSTIAIFNGKKITTKEARVISDSDCEDSNYITQMDDDVWLLPLKRELADYFNHSCEPNAGFLNTRKLADTLIAMRDINPGEQVTYHYAFTDIDAPYKFDCHCKALICTGTFSTSQYNDEKFYQKYWDYLAPFVRTRILDEHCAIAERLIKHNYL